MFKTFDDKKTESMDNYVKDSIHYSCSDGVVVYKSEWLEAILDDTPEFVDLTALEECVATVKLARETQRREELEKTIELKEKELESLKSKLERK